MDIKQHLSNKLERLHQILSGMEVSAEDCSDDGYYDFYFQSDLVTRTVECDGEKFPLRLKLHLCIHADEDTGVVSRQFNFIETCVDREIIEDFSIYSVDGVMREQANEVAHSLSESGQDFMKAFTEKTGIIFDLKSSMRDPRNILYSSVNVVFLD